MKPSKKPNSELTNQILARRELIRSLPKKQGVLSQDSFKGAKLPFVSVKTEPQKNS
jgi:hypothetical protein